MEQVQQDKFDTTLDSKSYYSTSIIKSETLNNFNI